LISVFNPGIFDFLHVEFNVRGVFKEKIKLFKSKIDFLKIFIMN
jgi:hypothetical protein